MKGGHWGALKYHLFSVCCYRKCNTIWIRKATNGVCMNKLIAHINARFEVITPVTMTKTLAWNVTPTSRVSSYQCFGNIYCFHLQGSSYPENGDSVFSEVPFTILHGMTSRKTMTFKKDKSTFVSFFFIIKPTRCTNFTNLFWHETLLVSDSSSVHHQEFIHCALSNGLCHTGL